MIRPATLQDIPFLLDVARAAYAQEFDEANVRKFLVAAIPAPSMLVLRSNNGLIVASIARQFWGGPPEAYVQFIACARPSRGLVGEGVALLRAVDTWRRERGAENLHFGEQTGINMAPLARRLGAVQQTPSYIIKGGAVRSRPAAPSPVALSGSTLLDRVLNYPLLPGERPALKAVSRDG